MSIVTKQGDKGRTKLLTGEEVAKTAPRFEAVGALDELTSHLGLARAILARCGDAALADEIEWLQRDLVRAGGELASKGRSEWVTPTAESHVQEIEQRIAAIEAAIELPREFILPGTTEAGAALDVARAVARRLERATLLLAERGEFPSRQGLIYLNRLSDYLFLLARKAEHAAPKGAPHE